MKITSAGQALEIARTLADSPVLVDAWYIWHEVEDGHIEDSEEEYCLNCAKQLLAWLRGGPKPEDADEGDRWWAGCTEDDSGIGGTDLEGNTPRYCGLCRRELYTTIVGVEDELEHFEMWVLGQNRKATPTDWRHIINILEEISVVESPHFPFPSMRPYEIECDRDLHRRALELVEKLFSRTTRMAFGDGYLQCAYSERGTVWHLRDPYAAMSYINRTLCGLLYEGRTHWETSESPPDADLCARCANALKRRA